MLRPLPIRVVPVDAALSYGAGMLRPLTLPGGLSFSDRYCLALAKREGIPALTAERR
jgi:ribonuclease VapC